MRMPNGFGTIYKLSGKRRNPFIAKKTVGFNEKGQPKYYVVGYFKTKKEALIALTEYNRTHGDKSKRPLIFSEVFEDWYKLKLSEELSKSRYANIRSLYNVHLAMLHDRTFKDITVDDLQYCVNTSSKRCKTATLSQMKLLFSELYKYALFNGIVLQDLSVMVKVPKRDDRKVKTPFTSSEIESLKVSDDDFAKYAYIMIYTGFRASEFIAIKREDISEDYVITGGMKTQAGKDRLVPCNEKIIPLVQEFLNGTSEYLVHTPDGKPMNYNQFVYRFKSAMERHNMQHTPHDTRHTFITLLSNAEANKVSIERLSGHASKGVTDSVYTHKDLEQLKKAINLI